MSSNIKKIYGLFILNEGGSCIYERRFTSQFDDLPVDLLSSFFSAIWSVSKTVMSESVEMIDLGRFRFIFSTKEDFLFIILSSSKENLLFINNVLEQISRSFMHGIHNLGWIVSMVVTDPQFDLLIDTLVLGEEDILQYKSNLGYFDIIQYLETLRANHTILGAALMTQKGTTLFSTLRNSIYNRAMKEFEIRYRTQGFLLTEHLYTLENSEKVIERYIKVKNGSFIILFIHFPSDTDVMSVYRQINSAVSTIHNSL